MKAIRSVGIVVGALAMSLAAAAGTTVHAQSPASASVTAAPAAPAAYPTTPVDVTYGATYVRGTLTWYYRSVGFTGTWRAIPSSGCRRVWIGTYDSDGSLMGARSTSTLCDGVKPVNLTIPADAPGGATTVRVCLDDGNAAPLKCSLYGHP
ncbi:hypothetical protein O7599_14265 [Streptomyces sp. WMMC500]|uniref:hypothetical protein n=1 Tax=Streptomyces sp. WMMC500 TaxID=3015154 RepID=UPI00248AACE1|nr:hypothetical protein [Streptomyces sp. WMMC500]WBB63611.1 hypothetical protein O7599_14265 [Streptomyces sp. WMMC500]